MELLATIAITAILIVAALVFVPSYTAWARLTADHQTLTILNDALTRYKTQGGNINALTAGAAIGNVLAKMSSPINWGGMVHQVMQKGATYTARSINAAGNRADYHFYRFNTYSETTPGASEATSEHPYGAGIGYMSNGGDPGGYTLMLNTGGGASYVAFKPNNSDSIIYLSGEGGYPPPLPAADSYTFWACEGNTGTQPPAGTLRAFICQNCQLTQLNVHGLTSLEYLDCCANRLTEIDISNCPLLNALHCNDNQLTSLDIRGTTQLGELFCWHNNITSLDVRDMYKDAGQLGLDAPVWDDLTGTISPTSYGLSIIYKPGQSAAKIPTDRNVVLYCDDFYGSDPSVYDDFYNTLPHVNVSSFGPEIDVPDPENCGTSSLATQWGWIIGPSR